MEMINDNMTQNTDSENQNTDVAESIVEETSHAKGKNTIDLGAMFRQLIQKKKVFFIVWSVVFVLACAWILPQPRYYASEVSLAPESSDALSGAGGLSSIASSFGINLGSMNSSDAIYPMLYPELFDSPEFVVSLFDIRVTTEDGTVETDYYTYLDKHTESNPILKPYYQMKKWFITMLSEPKSSAKNNSEGINPFWMSEDENRIFNTIVDNVTCSHDKKTDVITISVKDQDPLICATLADSIMHRLQNFIVQYRTSKARLDVEYYQNLVDSTKADYEASADKYAKYCDSHKDAILQVALQERDELEAEMSNKLNTYTAMQAQLQAMKAKVQERTPAFTTLKSATVPNKPAGPKRMLFVLGMELFATIVAIVWILRKALFKI